MQKTSAITRRNLLKGATAVALGAPYVLTSSALGAAGRPPASERIGVGCIGIGAMGQGHVRHCLELPEAQIVAVCDVDRWRREHAKAAVEARYAEQRPGGQYRGCEAYHDLRDLLARHDVDAVLIATGDRWHALATSLAVKAGKDVYCEKPISLTVREARAMVEVVRRHGRVFQGGLQQRSSGEFIKACDLVRAGAIGKVRVVYVNHPGTVGDVGLPAEPVPDGLDWDLWLGPAPWHPYNSRFHPYGQPPHVVPWHFCRDFGGGNLTSNAVHAFDVVQWGLSMDEGGPVEITPPETGEVPVLTYRYASGVLLQVVGGRIDPQRLLVPEGFVPAAPIQDFGALFVGEGGWIHVGRGGYLKGFPQEVLEALPGWQGRRPPARSHHQNWLDCIRTRGRPACDVSVGCQSTIVSHLGCIAHWTGRTLKWDPLKELFVGDEEANRWLDRPKREPWRI
jgi:hypothetical protein